MRSLAGIDEYALANGLTVLLFPDPSQPTVTVNITYLVGSRHEGYGETGMAHLLEHMLFKGTPTRRNGMKLVDERGGFANGSTWTDRTNYFETLPASEENLRFALELEADRMVNATISAEDLASEFSVVRNELELGENDPVRVLVDRVSSAAYLWHNYGKSTIGSRSDVENVPVDRLRAFYERHYQPDNAVLVVAGRYDVATALAEIERTFGAIPRPTRTLPPTYTVEPVQDGERTVTLRRVGDVPVLVAAYHGVAGADPDLAAFRALCFAMTDEPGGRLYQALVATGLASEVSSWAYSFHDPGLVIFGVKVRDASSVEHVKQVLLAELEGVAARPLTAAELDRWRARTLKDIVLGLSDSSRVAIRLSEWVAAGDWRLMLAYHEQVKSLDLESVRRVAASYLVPANRTLGEFVPTRSPERAPLPPRPDIAAVVAGVAATHVEEGEPFSVDLDHLQSRTLLRTLAGGISAAFVPRRTRGGKVELELVLHHGDEASLTGRGTVAELAARLARRGSERLDYQALEDRLAELTANVEIRGGAGQVSVEVTSVRASLPAVIAVVAELLRTPAFDPGELEVVRREVLSELEEARTDPQQLAFVAFSRELSPWPAGHPRATMTIEEEIAAVRAVTLEEIRDYHARLWGAGAAEVAAVGDFDPEALAAQLERSFGAWTAKVPYVRVPDRAFEVEPALRTIDTPDKEMAILVGGHPIELAEDHPDAAAMVVAARIFGSSTGSRIWMRLREQEGFSYGVWGWAQLGQLDPVGQVGFGAIAAPHNTEAARAALVEEMRKLVDGGVATEEVEKAAKGWLDQLDNLLADDRTLVGILRLDRELGRDWSWWRQRRAAVRAVSDAELNRVLKTWFHPERLVIVTAGDLARARL